MFELILGALASIGAAVAAGGKKVANSSDCSDSDRQLGKDIQKAGNQFSNTMNRFIDRLNDDD
ncbi:MAG: hypothetical protein K2L10_07890 [Ruminococcus sp.]|nr:hypothetical protein [Ruminococcus sp.]